MDEESTMTEVEIRPFRAEMDRDAVADVTRRAWGGMTMAELRELRFGVLDGKSWQDHKADAVVAGMEQHPDCALVAVIDSKVVGYATYRVEGSIGTVGNNAVDPDWQGRGIGSILISDVLDALRATGVTVIEVTTFEHDAAARAVYERLGFELVAKSAHYALTQDKPSGSSQSRGTGQLAQEGDS
jgi:ribosomal protein S18 acetylase RimI-like enzyme